MSYCPSVIVYSEVVSDSCPSSRYPCRFCVVLAHRDEWEGPSYQGAGRPLPPERVPARPLKGAARYRDSALTTAEEPTSSPTTSRSAWSGSRRSPACWGLSRRAAWANKWMDPQNPGILRSSPCSILDACASSLCPQVHRAPLDAAKAPSLVWANVWWRMQAAGADTASIYPCTYNRYQRLIQHRYLPLNLHPNRRPILCSSKGMPRRRPRKTPPRQRKSRTIILTTG